MSEAIYVKGLSKAYNGKTVLDKLDLRAKILPVGIKSH